MQILYLNFARLKLIIGLYFSLMDKNVLSLVKISIVKILACGADCLNMYKYYNLESLSDIQTSLFGRIFFI